MTTLALHELHEKLGARFAEVNGCEVVEHYGDALAEHAALRNDSGVLDLSGRSRLCLTGGDRVRFLNGQVTNNVKDLRAGEGCYAALVTAKGKLQSDLNAYALADELLLDFEPGLTEAVAQRLAKYIIADDVQVTDVGALYGLLSVQGPKAKSVLRKAGLSAEIPAKSMTSTTAKDEALGEIYVMNHARLGTNGFDLFVPTAAVGALLERLISAGGRACGWQALEMARIEAGIPRFGVDMDETNLAPECLEERAISYSKGCYIGQEVIARIRTYGQVTRSLRGLRFASATKTLPIRGDKLFHEGKEAGFITSALASPALGATIALGYVRKETNQIGAELTLRTADGDIAAKIVPLPFG